MPVNLQNNHLLPFYVTLPFWENFVIRRGFANRLNVCSRYGVGFPDLALSNKNYLPHATLARFTSPLSTEKVGRLLKKNRKKLASGKNA
jgi:hypothetical protein